MSHAVLTAVLAGPPSPVPLSQVFWSEVAGTALLTLLGCGVVANVLLARTLGHAGGWLLVTIGWSLGVLAGVYAAYRSGGHLNPAVTAGLLASGATSYAPGVAVSATSTLTYLAGEFAGAFAGAVGCFLAYKRHFDVHGLTLAPAADSADVAGTARAEPAGARADPRAPRAGVLAAGRRPGATRPGPAGSVPGGAGDGADEGEGDGGPGEGDGGQGALTASPRREPAGAADKLGVFCTAPAVPAVGWNLLTELIGTFVLVFVVLLSGHTPSGLGPLAVALLVVGIGASLGGPTGYAINPARDLGPRIAHAVLPIRGKGGSNWRYAWVPVAGPLAGGVLAGLAARLLA